MSTFVDYYLILGVTINSTQEDVKKAYRKLVKEFHPDLNPNKDATAKMQLINEAFFILSDDRARALYNVKYRNYYSNNRPPNSQSERFQEKTQDYKDEKLDDWIRKARQHAKDMTEEVVSNAKKTTKQTNKKSSEEIINRIFWVIIFGVITVLLRYLFSQASNKIAETNSPINIDTVNTTQSSAAYPDTMIATPAAAPIADTLTAHPAVAPDNTNTDTIVTNRSSYKCYFVYLKIEKTCINGMNEEKTDILDCLSSIDDYYGFDEDGEYRIKDAFEDKFKREHPNDGVCHYTILDNHMEKFKSYKEASERFHSIIP